MPHPNPGDPNVHYSAQGENATGAKVKGSLAKIDPELEQYT
jgi:hypothetical protein